MRPSVTSTEVRARRPFRFAGCLWAVLALGAAIVLDAGSAPAASPAPTGPFFALSPMQAVSPGNGSSTRYSVTVTNPPIGNAPFARWYLDLKTSGRTGPACSDAVLIGGQRLAPNRYGWRNQGTTFVWYHGARHSYASDPAYGCDQSSIGHDGYPGTVTAVFENDSQHCTATFTGIASGARPEYGPPPVCALGGYIPIPVPRRLLQTYAKVQRELGALARQVQSGTVSGQRGALTRALSAILRPQTDAYGSLFPPVWGCGFAGVFSQVLELKQAFTTQLAELAAGTTLPNSTLDQDLGYMRAMVGEVHACRPSSTNPIGAPASVVQAVNQLAAEAVALRAQTGRATHDPALLGTGIRQLATRFNGLVTRSFPVVFGMPYGDLVDRVLGEDSSLQVAERAAQAGQTSAAVSALKGLAGQEQAIGSALRKQAKRAAKAENAA